MTVSASSRCPHSDVGFDINHNHMADSNVSAVEIKAKCNICGTVMSLTRGVPMGASSRHPARSADDDGNAVLIIPMIAKNEEPTKEWGFSITRRVVGEQP